MSDADESKPTTAEQVSSTTHSDKTLDNKDTAHLTSEESVVKSDHKTCDSQANENGTEQKEGNQPDFSESHDYELINGHYYYTDSSSGQRYMYDANKGEWVAVDASEEKQDQQVTVDDEGRTYYYADDMHLCRDPHGNVFYWEENEWKPWTQKAPAKSDSASEKKDSKWYFYQGDDTFYRDNTSDVVYKLNKETNEWQVHEGKLKKKRPRIDEEEEFDTESEDSDEEEGDGTAPPGVKNDPNIEYDGVTYTKRDPSDNMVYEWDVNRRAWFPKLDEDFMATYQLSYGFNPDGTKNENPLKFDDEEEKEAARLAEEEEKRKAEKMKEGKKKPTWFDIDDSRNNKVYVSNLPESTTEEEFLELMQKCGMVLKDVVSNKYKVKMYRDGDGNFKGDALCTYIKIESVDLALQILDGYQVGNKMIRVERAKFEQKGEYNPKLRPPKRKKKDLEKIQKQQQKLFDWRPEPLRGQRQKHENTVIIKNVFDPKEFETVIEKMLTHKEAIRNQCLNFGHVRKIELYDLHPDGVVQVVFQEVEAADMCVATLNNRLYEGRTLQVSTWDGRTKFKIEETEEEKQKRLQKWNQFLESEEPKS
ncbi:17S U2 SnRNP complex component HTATSF1-like [Penaeus indicus]|uniref:17S U2 SnRNP complex component HTATSF1-like n=1 Tax=Penaeus indicus TaxID=29960 RepID=UPI00300D53D7